MDETNRLLGLQDETGKGSENSDTQKGKYMIFKSGPEYFGLEIQYVQQIIQYQEVTKVPETEDYIKGLINLRGRIIPVVDVRLRFHQGACEYNDKTCILVINVKSTTVGLVVEQIAEVVEIPEENMRIQGTMWAFGCWRSWRRRKISPFWRKGIKQSSEKA